MSRSSNFERRISQTHQICEITGSSPEVLEKRELLAPEEARQIASNVVKLPELLRKP